jgi:hypothetical protein
MRPLHAGVDITVIALWLGHENVTTTQIYKPTWPSSSEPSTGPPRPQPRRAATSRPTSSSRSSKHCDYADTGPVTAACQRFPALYRHNRGVGVMSHACLHGRLRPGRGDLLAQPAQPVAAADDHVLHAPVPQLRQRLGPRLGGCAGVTVASSRMQVTPARTRSAIRTPGRAPWRASMPARAARRGPRSPPR